jgi:galactose mutarotase-like enzyme
MRFDAGYPCAQVFAPLEKDVICFEPMTAPADALRSVAFAVAEPGSPYHAAFTITVDRS